MLLREIAETKISAAHLRKILDTIPTLASCNLPDGSNEFLNQRWHDYTGLSPQEARGQSPFIQKICRRCWTRFGLSGPQGSRVRSNTACGGTTANIAGSCSVL